MPYPLVRGNVKGTEPGVLNMKLLRKGHFVPLLFMNFALSEFGIHLLTFSPLPLIFS